MKDDPFLPENRLKKLTNSQDFPELLDESVFGSENEEFASVYVEFYSDLVAETAVFSTKL